MMARTKGGPYRNSVLLRHKKLELAVRFFEENSTRTTLPESFIVGRCLIFELELDIDSESKVLMETWSMFNVD